MSWLVRYLAIHQKLNPCEYRELDRLRKRAKKVGEYERVDMFIDRNPVE